MHEDRIRDLEVLLGHVFRSRTLMIEALSHSSVKNSSRPSNERLEFLGDSVLGMIIAEALFRRFPDEPEGTMTRIKSQAVSRQALGRVATAMGLERFLMVGKGVAKREMPVSLLGNLFEALVGAIYLDAGLAAARRFILRHLDVVIAEIVEDRAEKNYKSMLQHHCQRELGAVPNYRVLREGGPAHSRTFDVSVVVNGKEVGRARADSKKIAEQGAARAALIHYDAVDENPKREVRGSGTILRVGASGGGGGGGGGGGSGGSGDGASGGRGRRRRSRRGRGGGGGGERNDNGRSESRSESRAESRAESGRGESGRGESGRGESGRGESGRGEGDRERSGSRRGRRGGRRRRGRDANGERKTEKQQGEKQGEKKPAKAPPREPTRPAADKAAPDDKAKRKATKKAPAKKTVKKKTTAKKPARKKTAQKTTAPEKAAPEKPVRKKTAKKATRKKTTRKAAKKPVAKKKPTSKKGAKKSPPSRGRSGGDSSGDGSSGGGAADS